MATEYSNTNLNHNYHTDDDDYQYRPDYYRDPDYNIPDECDLSNKPHNRNKW